MEVGVTSCSRRASYPCSFRIWHGAGPRMRLGSQNRSANGRDRQRAGNWDSGVGGRERTKATLTVGEEILNSVPQSTAVLAG